MLRRLVLVIALLVVTATALAPGAGAVDLLDRKKLHARVGTAVTTAYPDLPVTTVKCPKKVKARAGFTATCSVTAGAYDLTMLVSVLDEKGRVTIASTQAVIPKASAEYIVLVNSTLPVTADCGPEPYIVRRPGEPFVCTATFTDGTTQQVTVTPGDTAGNATITAVSDAP